MFEMLNWKQDTGRETHSWRGQASASENMAQAMSDEQEGEFPGYPGFILVSGMGQTRYFLRMTI